MKAHGRPVEELHKRLRQDVLARMLLHVIRAACVIDSPVNGLAGEAARNNMNDVATRLILDAVHERYIVEGSKIVGLPAGCGIERRFVENDSDFVTGGSGFDNPGIEFEK